MESDRGSLMSRLAALEAEGRAESNDSGSADVELLDALPYVNINFAHAPDGLIRRLFEVLAVRVQLDLACGEVTISITLPGMPGCPSWPGPQRGLNEPRPLRGTHPPGAGDRVVHRVFWYPQRDSNPCYRLERAASWATRR
jgi:site-specific DNA recombinase